MTEWIYDPRAGRCRKTDGGQAMSDFDLMISIAKRLNDDRVSLQAEVDRQRAEIERLTRERNEARAEYARLCDDIERIENDAWHDGAKHGTSH